MKSASVVQLPPVAMPIRSFARSIGQIVLQRDAGMGAAIVIALFWVSPRLGCALLIGSSIGNLVGHIFADPNSMASQHDLHGFNGALSALAAFTFIESDSIAGATAVLAAISASGLSATMTRALRSHNLPAYSSPAIIVTWAWRPFTPAVYSPGTAGTDTWYVGKESALVHGSHTDMQALLVSLAAHVVAGLAPIVFASGLLAGSIILTGLILTRPATAVWALTGSALGLCLCAAAGAPQTGTISGACGFNSALAAMAMCRLGVKPVVVAVSLTCLIEWAGSMVGIPLLTAPFVLASWAVQAFSERESDPLSK